MSFYKSYAVDQEIEQNGVLVTYPDMERKEPEAIRIKLARLTGRSSRYKQVRERLMKPYRGNSYDAESSTVKEELNRRLFVESAILSWETKHYEGCVVAEGVPSRDGWYKGIELRDADGKDVIVPSTIENICEGLKLAPDFGAALLVEASGNDLFMAERREDDSKN